MSRNSGEEQGYNPASLEAHEVRVTIVGKDGVLQTDCFESVAAKQPTPAGLVLLNQDGQVIAFYTYDRLVSAIAKQLDKPKSGVIAVTALPFPGVH